MARRFQCALTVCAFLTVGQQAIATLGQAAAAARQAPALDPALRADVEKLMEMTGATQLAAQMASQVTDAFLNGFKQQTQNVVPPRVYEIVREVFTTEFSAAFSGPEVKDKLAALYAKYFTHV